MIHLTKLKQKTKKKLAFCISKGTTNWGQYLQWFYEMKHAELLRIIQNSRRIWRHHARIAYCDGRMPFFEHQIGKDERKETFMAGEEIGFRWSCVDEIRRQTAFHMYIL